VVEGVLAKGSAVLQFAQVAAEFFADARQARV
jgi:hypothetical protein